MSRTSRFVVSILFIAVSSPLVTHAQTQKRAHLSLRQILEHAEKHAPLIRIGRAQLGLGKAEVEAARPLMPEDPELELAIGPRLSSEGRTIEFEASLRQRLEISGARGMRMRLAERTQDRLESELKRLRWEVHRKVHAAYHFALVARQRVAAAQHMVAFARRLLEITRKRHAAGAISMLDVRVAEGEAAQAGQREIRAKNAYQVACLKLAEAAGWPGRAPEPKGDLEPPRPAPPLGKLVELAQKRHPELRSSLAAMDEAGVRVKLAARNAFPRPAVGVAYGREAEPARPTNHIVVATLGLSLPIWRRNQGARARASAADALARARYRALKQALPARVERAARSLTAAAKRIAVYGREVIPAFQRSLEMIGRAYSEGKVDVLQVMVARSRFLEIYRGTLDAYEDYYKGHAALEAVVGTEIWSTGPAEHTKEAGR